MNVVRDLRNTITHLQAELERKEKLLSKQRQQYEQMIGSLQHENQRLKALLEGESLASHNQQLFKDDSRIANVRKGIEASKEMIAVDSNEYTELINENVVLRNEMAELSLTYQKQIDQLVFYFDKIKQESRKYTATNQAGEILLIKNWMGVLIKDIDNEKQKYAAKLRQCAQTLEMYEGRVAELEERVQGLQGELAEAHQRLRILARISF